MRLGNSRESKNVDDRRSSGPRVGRGSIGVGTIVLALVAMYFGIDPNVVLQGVDQTGTGSTNSQPQPIPADDARAQFVARVLGETEDTWRDVFKQQTQGTYEDPGLVLFKGATPTACGTGQSAMGPFYCPADRKVYIDLSFFSELSGKLGAPGDFAQAYVIAHEVGHHVQTLTGTSQKVQAMRQSNPSQANELSVRMELQADCYAGIWAHHAQAARGILEAGDIEEGIGAAGAVGDDTLQRRSQGRVVPDSFTHGSSAQRISWFKRGWESGKMSSCNTFAAAGG